MEEEGSKWGLRRRGRGKVNWVGNEPSYYSWEEWECGTEEREREREWQERRVRSEVER